MKSIIVFFLLSFSLSLSSQKRLPYKSIPPYPETYTPATITARLIDGLGYRYYWATEDLSADDLNYRASTTSRTSVETLEHIHQLVLLIQNGVLNQPQGERPSSLPFVDIREQTLYTLFEISSYLKANEHIDLDKRNIIFKRGDKTSEFPFWHQLNGPIADALWHVGQIVANRRASGNPLSSKVNVFTGQNRD